MFSFDILGVGDTCASVTDCQFIPHSQCTGVCSCETGYFGASCTAYSKDMPNEPCCEKTGFSAQVCHKPGCATTEDGQRLEISDSVEEGLCYPYRENKGTDLRFCFRICTKTVFS